MKEGNYFENSRHPQTTTVSSSDYYPQIKGYNNVFNNCSNTNNKFYFDAEDYELIKQYCWRENVSRKYHELTTCNITSTKHLHSTQNIRFSKIINCENSRRSRKKNQRYQMRIQEYFLWWSACKSSSCSIRSSKCII